VVNDLNIEVWDLDSSQLLRTLIGNYESVIHSLKWNSTGGLATASYDGTIHIWDIQTGQVTSSINAAGTLRSMDWSPDGSRLAYGGDSGVLEIKDLPSADAGPGQTLTDTNNDGTELVTLDGSGSSDPDGTITGYEWREDGEVIATGANPQVTLGVGEHTITLVVTDDDGLVDTDEVVVTIGALRQHSMGTITNLEWHPDSDILAIVFDDDLAFSRDEQQSVWLYTTAGEPMVQLPLAPNHFVRRMSWSRSGNKIAILTSQQDTDFIFIVNTTSISSPFLLTSFPQQHPTVNDIAWSSDDQAIAINFMNSSKFGMLNWGQNHRP